MNDRATDDELTRRLEAYAEARLSPDLSTTTRMRAEVMAAALGGAEAARADADPVPTVGMMVRVDRERRPAWRRPMALLLAAGLAVALSVSSVAAAQPGGPLYGTRIWAETLTLPSTANERAQAELRRLDARLAEAAAATAAGDTNAANAALEAYGAIVTEATVGGGGSVAAAARLDTGVRRNIEVLTILAERVPAQDRDAIKHAIDRSGSALDTIHGRPAGNPPAGPPGGNPNKPAPDPAEQGTTPEPAPKPDHTPPGPLSEIPGKGGGASQGNSQAN